MGISVYSLIVVQQKHFSAFAGGVALAIMMVPTITRTTEEMLATVPHAIREAALGLGVPKWRTVLSISLRTASPGIITGCMLAFARVAGETAPLLFTAFGNQFWTLQPQRAHRRAAAADLTSTPSRPTTSGTASPGPARSSSSFMIMVSVTLVRIFASRGELEGRTAKWESAFRSKI